jgi:hypothetical protein
MRLSISEIVNKASKLETDQQKVEWLRSRDHASLRIVLKYMYDTDNVTFMIPDTAPPWKKNDYIGVEGMLYNEARRLRIFVKGGGYDQLNQVKRENLFISLLEDIDNDDADLLCKMIKQQPLEGLPKSVVVAAFPNEFSVVTTS